MNFKRRFIAYLCIICMLAGVIYVPDQGSADAAKKLKLSRKTASVNIGDTVKIKVRNAKKATKVKWKTSKKSVATIIKKKSKGKKAYATIKAAAAGKAKITAKCKTGKKKQTLTCKITVAAAPAPAGPSSTDKQGGTTTQPGKTDNGTDQGRETAKPDNPGNSDNPTDAPATDKPDTPTEKPDNPPTATPTKAPTNPPAATATPFNPGQDNFSAVTNARATVDLSSFEAIAGGGAYDATNRRVSINDGETGANSQGSFAIPSNITINNDDLVTFRVQGYYYGTAPFRFWIGSAMQGSCTPIMLVPGNVDSNNAVGDYPEVVNGVTKNQMKLNVDPTTKAFDVTFTFKAGVSQNDTNGSYTRLTIKYVMDENENGFIDGLMLNHIYVVPTNGQSTGPTPTPGQATQAPSSDYANVDLSQVTGDKASYATYNSSTGKLVLNDTSDNTTTIWFPLPKNISSGEKVTITF